MIKEALALILDRTKAGQNPEPHVLSGGGRVKMMILNGQVLHDYIAEPPDRQIYVESLSSFCDAVNHFGTEDAFSMVSMKNCNVNCVCDRDLNTDIIFNLVPTPQAEAISKLMQGVTQSMLVKILRTTLRDCCSNDDFLSIARQMSFNVNAASHGRVESQGESMGRKVEKAVRAEAGELPDVITMTYPMFLIEHLFSSSVTFAVHVDYDQEKIILIPVGESMVLAKQAVSRTLFDHIDKNTNFPVYEGNYEQ